MVTKAAAADVKNRPRDAFDIFVTVGDQPRAEFAHKWVHLSTTDGLFSDANEALCRAVYDGDAIDKIVAVLEGMRVAGQLNAAMPGSTEIRGLFSFLVDT